MAHALTATSRIAVSRGDEREIFRDGDPLRAMRGVMFGVAASLLLFWLPLALVIWR